MTTPLPGKPILTRDMCDFVRRWTLSQGYRPENLRITKGPDPQKFAGMEIVVSAAPGGGLRNEYATELLSWQFRVYGPKSRDGDRANDAAEVLAWQLDRMMILLKESDTVINGHKIIDSYRYGSPPAAMPKDNSGRYSYVATYIVDVPSGI